jgi:F-type H+-transporting ATPase subunit gamma
VASLREIKDRIGSVRSTLKITSAMKLVASAKLRKAQKAIEGMRPYERTLAEILSSLSAARPDMPASRRPSSLSADAETGFGATNPAAAEPSPSGNIGAASSASSEAGTGAQPLPADSHSRPDRESRTAVVAIASNSSLCGGFNANVIRKTLETIRACEGEVEVFPLGRKMTEAMRRNGYPGVKDYNDLIGHPSYEKSAALARELAGRYQAGELSRVILVYNHFAAAASQVPTVEQYLPFTEIPDRVGDDGKGASVLTASHSNSSASQTSSSASQTSSSDSHSRLDRESPEDVDYILEPDAETLVSQLLPQVLMLKFHAAILDSAAAEHAARTIAMQTATDNAEDLLGELTLEYNKGRQQKITAEILDLLGGAQG